MDDGWDDNECQECDHGMVYGPEWEDWDRMVLMECEFCDGTGIRKED